VIKSISSTNAMKKAQGDSSAEVLNVSRQRLSLCSPAIADSKLTQASSVDLVRMWQQDDSDMTVKSPVPQ